jgi:transcriptional regulator with XRE-family HTH domain
MTAPESFAYSLRQQRERRGLTLAAIAAATKISPNLLVSLERGDVSRWPGGIYRRAFVRAYAAAVGLPPEPTLCEFIRLFPEPGQHPPAALLDDDPHRLRLTLITEPRWKAPALRAAAAVIDAGVVLFAGNVVAALAGTGFWTGAGIAGLTYHSSAAVLVGRSAGAWLIASGRGVRKPNALRDQFADLRQSWFPTLVNARENSAEHPAAT